MAATILIVEDEFAVARGIQYALQQEGYEVTPAVDGTDAESKLSVDMPFDLLILDIMMPGRSGLEICREVRARSAVPIIILTAKDSEVDKVVGLEVGADDYVTKPYRIRELVARIRSVLRRSGGSLDDEGSSDEVLAVGDVRLDPERHQVFVRGEEVRLPLREFEVLELLLANAGRVVTRETLIDRIWGFDYVGDTKTLDVHIKRLRSKVEDEPSHPTRIITIRGLGYRYEKPKV